MAGLFSGTASRALSVAVSDYQNQLNAGRAINEGLHAADRREREVGLMAPPVRRAPVALNPYATNTPPVGAQPAALDQFKVASVYAPSAGLQTAAPSPAQPGVVPPGGAALTSPVSAAPQTASGGQPNAVPVDANGVPRPTLRQWQLMNPETKQTILDAVNRNRFDITGVPAGKAMASKRVPKKPLTMQEFEKTLEPGADPNIASAYAQRGATAPAAGLKTPAAGNQYQPIFDAASRAYGVDVSLLTRMAAQESGFDTTATSPKGAGGVMQLMPGTASDLQVSDVYDPQQNIMGGANYISQMLKKYNGDEQLALMAYNWGPGNVDNWIATGRDPERIPAETFKYVEKILGAPPTKDGSTPSLPAPSKDSRVRFAVSKPPEQYDYESKTLMQRREQHIAVLQQTQQQLEFQQQQADRAYMDAQNRFNAAKQAGDYEGMRAAMQGFAEADRIMQDANARLLEFTTAAQTGIDEYNNSLIKLESDRAVRELASGDPRRAAMLYSSLGGAQRRYEPSSDGSFVAIDGSGAYVLEPGTGRAKKYSVVDIAYELYGLADKERAAAIDAGRAAEQGKLNEHALKIDEKLVDVRQALATAQIKGEYDLKQKLMEMDRDVASVQKMDDGSLYIIYKGGSGKVVKISPDAVQKLEDGTEIPANEITIEYTGAGVNTSGAPVN